MAVKHGRKKTRAHKRAKPLRESAEEGAAKSTTKSTAESGPIRNNNPNTERTDSAVDQSVDSLSTDSSEFVLTAPRYPSEGGFALDECTETRVYRIPVDRPVRVYCDGVYDLFHYGHSRQLMQAKGLFPSVYLIAGVHSDRETLSNKGVSVMSEQERYESVRHCKYVDEVLVDAPWVITGDFIEEHGIDFVAHDEAPYRSQDHEDIYAEAKSLGRFVPTRRTVGISTSEIITRIVRDYDVYVRRQLLRGIPGEDLNISALEERRLMAEQRGGRFGGIRASFRYVLRHWEGLSHLWLQKFLWGFERPAQTLMSRVFGFVRRRRVTAK